MHQRRTNAAGLTKVFQKLLGMEAKLRQYVEGEGFVKAVEKEGGRPLFDLVWQKPENLPTAEEIRDPQTWITRMKALGPCDAKRAITDSSLTFRKGT
jgi:uncharacterized protein (DUF2342 family)